MKRIIFLLLAIVLVAGVGCGENAEETSEDYQQSSTKVSGGSLIDPVDNQPVDVTVSNYTYIYEDFEYNFNTKENMEAFMKDPKKYIKDE